MVFFGAMKRVLPGKRRALSAFVRHFSVASDPQRLAGKVAVITGGASGLGKATAGEFVRNGARVILADVPDDLGHVLVAELGRDAACYVRCDVADEVQVAAAVDLAVARHGRLDVVFNNAGVSGVLTPVPISALDLADFDRVMAVNTRGVMAGVKHAARVMVPRRGGSIICTASTAGVLGGVATMHGPIHRLEPRGGLARPRRGRGACALRRARERDLASLRSHADGDARHGNVVPCGGRRRAQADCRGNERDGWAAAATRGRGASCGVLGVR
ncbi:hypothetical protein EJB05_10680 [Eragrostis curvula]|uniref:Ketoreductase domain-containing protein n=1 Tax=Eragrostis curvula TaxID=38414 RepID=A0A5J9VQL2_9POAL|nr:hypothetical protein EJB05_10680 [Eragrostis curvula]